MKDLLVSLIQFIFENDFNDDYTFKRLIIVLIKVLTFLLVCFSLVWLLIELK